MLNVTLTLLSGFKTTLSLFFLTLLFALPLGLIISFGTMSKWAPCRRLLYGRENPGLVLRALADFRPLSAVCKFVVWIIRSSPLLLQILIIFYVPGLLFHLPLLPRFTAALVAFVVNYACYFSEIYRGGIQSIPTGQYEAGQVLGMTKSQIFFKITLLQVIKRIVPPMGNEMITLVKDTALVRVIAIYEIIWMGESYIKKGLIWPLFYTAVFYLIFNGILTILLSQFEKKLDYFK